MADKLTIETCKTVKDYLDNFVPDGMMRCESPRKNKEFFLLWLNNHVYCVLR